MRGGVVVGRGGTGKSEVLRRLVAALKERGVQAHVVAFTHVAAANCDGGTILHELYANKHQKQVALCVDEASMVSLKMWAQIAKFHFTGAMVFVFGDWEGQFLPIADQGREGLLRSIDWSNFMHALCNGARVELNKFRRGGDRAHFDLVGGIYPSICTLDVALPRARQAYPAIGRAMGTVLVVTHRERIARNAEMNVRLSPRDFVEIAPPERPAMGDNQPQQMRLWTGIVLMAVVGSAHKHLKNGLRYRVEEVGVAVQLARVDDGGAVRGEPFQMGLADVARDLRLTHALCYYSCQARTIHGPLRLAQTDSRWFTLRHLIVGLGRAPAGNCVEVE
jgi:hypothetical protein